MFSKMRKYLTYTNVLLTLALVFVMTGGALAANHYLITSTKQISPKVLAALKGKTGGAGAPGAQGGQGAQGAQGPVGKEGTAGKNGEKGEKGANGTNGATGPTGPVGATGPAGATGAKGATGSSGATGAVGSPWTVGNKLPSGATETGVWVLAHSTTNGEQVTAPISFTLKVESAGKGPEGGEFNYAGKTSAHCKGSSTAPTAEPGYLCVYDALEEKPLGGVSTIAFNGFVSGEEPFGQGAAVGKEGSIAQFETVNIGTASLPFADGEGTWAVTAQ